MRSNLANGHITTRKRYLQIRSILTKATNSTNVMGFQKIPTDIIDKLGHLANGSGNILVNYRLQYIYFASVYSICFFTIISIRFLNF